MEKFKMKIGIYPFVGIFSYVGDDCYMDRITHIPIKISGHIYIKWRLADCESWLCGIFSNDRRLEGFSVDNGYSILTTYGFSRSIHIITKPATFEILRVDMCRLSLQPKILIINNQLAYYTKWI